MGFLMGVFTLSLVVKQGGITMKHLLQIGLIGILLGSLLLIPSQGQNLPEVINAQNVVQLTSEPLTLPSTLGLQGQDFAWSANSRLLALSVGRLWLFEVDTQILTEFPQTQGIRSQALFLPDNERVVYLTHNALVIYDWVNDRFVQTPHEGARMIALSPDSTLLALGGGRGEMSLWTIDDLSPVARFKTMTFDDDVLHLAFSPEGDRLLSTHLYSGIMVWDLTQLPNTSDYTAIRPMLEISGVSRGWLDFLTDIPDQLIYIHEGSLTDVQAQIGVFSTRQDQLYFTATSHPPIQLGDATSYELSAGSDLLFVGDSQGTIGVYDVINGKNLHQFKAHSVSVVDIAISPDQRWLVSAGFTENIQLWQVIP
jgi:WD40 repeat protein